MAAGVPEADVFAAADRVLERGERPTVERVRVQLGRGSPARVGQLLDAWWDALARRLAGETRMPDLPKAASAAFSELWRVATDQARTQLESEIADRRAALDAQAQHWATERASTAEHLAEAGVERAAANDARLRTEERLADLQRLLVQRESQHADDVVRIGALSARAQVLELERHELVERLAAREAAAAQEREVTANHLRTVEDRANVEIDRARQETKGLRTRLERVEHEAIQATQFALQREHDLRNAAARAEQTATTHQARIDVLEEQLVRLDGLGEALRSAQEAIRAGLEREDQLRWLRKEKVVGKKVPSLGSSPKKPKAKTSTARKRP